MSTTATTLSAPVAPARPTTRRHGLIIYLAGAFLFTWLLLSLSVIAAGTHSSPPLPDALLITLATLGPTLAALTARAYEGGWPGVRQLLGQAARWRVAPRWYAVALLGPAVVMGGGFLLWLVLGGPLPPPPPLLAWLQVPVLILALLLPALCEEIGWRGFALPRLQARYGMLTASLIVGVVHACWHIPIFLIPSAGFGQLPFAFFALFVLALSVVMTWLYNRTGGSVLLTGLTHAAFNAWPLPWTLALSLLPEGVRGLHIQIPMALALTVWALIVVLKTRRTPAQ